MSRSPGKRRDLGKILILFLFVFSVLPACIVGLVGALNARVRLQELETYNEQSVLQSQISPIASKIEVYRELIKFTSQLPAAEEILGGGQDLLGSIESFQQSVNRYSGVLKRVFRNYPEITDVRLYDSDRNALLHVASTEDRGLEDHSGSDHEHLISDSLFSDILKLEENHILITTRRIETGESGFPGNQLVLEMMTPVISSDERIGLFVCSVNIGILSLSYPDIEWVFENGDFLVRETAASAFDRYPELKQIFLSGQPGISHGEDFHAWIPLFSDGTGKALLWAGRVVTFSDSERYIYQTYKTIFTTILVLFMGILIFGYFVTERIKRYYFRLYGFFEKRLVENNTEISLPFSGYVDIDRFLDRIRIVVDKNTRIQDENNQLIMELKEALNNVKELKGLLPVCSSCRKVRDDDGYWANLDEYITRYTDTSISHSLCPDCLQELYPEYADRVIKKVNDRHQTSPELDGGKS